MNETKERNEDFFLFIKFFLLVLSTHFLEREDIQKKQKKSISSVIFNLGKFLNINPRRYKTRTEQSQEMANTKSEKSEGIPSD